MLGSEKPANDKEINFVHDHDHHHRGGDNIDDDHEPGDDGVGVGDDHDYGENQAFNNEANGQYNDVRVIWLVVMTTLRMTNVTMMTMSMKVMTF